MSYRIHPSLHRPAWALIAVATVAAAPCRADVVTSWNETACNVLVSAGIPAPGSYRAIAMVQVAVREAVDEIAADSELGDAARSERSRRQSTARAFVRSTRSPIPFDVLLER